MTISETLDATLADGGGTFDADTLEPIVDGPWAVGGSMAGDVVPLNGNALMVGAYFAEAIRTLCLRGAVTIGTWVDEGMLYVDAVDLVDDTDEAIALAAERGELAIYHLTDKVTLEVSR